MQRWSRIVSKLAEHWRSIMPMVLSSAFFVAWGYVVVSMGMFQHEHGGAPVLQMFKLSDQAVGLLGVTASKPNYVNRGPMYEYVDRSLLAVGAAGQIDHLATAFRHEGWYAQRDSATELVLCQGLLTIELWHAQKDRVTRGDSLSVEWGQVTSGRCPVGEAPAIAWNAESATHR